MHFNWWHSSALLPASWPTAVAWQPGDYLNGILWQQPQLIKHPSQLCPMQWSTHKALQTGSPSKPYPTLQLWDAKRSTQGCVTGGGEGLCSDSDKTETLDKVSLSLLQTLPRDSSYFRTENRVRASNNVACSSFLFWLSLVICSFPIREDVWWRSFKRSRFKTRIDVL